MTRVVHFLPDVCLAGGGVQRAAIDLCRALPDGQTRVTLALFDDVDVPGDWDVDVRLLGERARLPRFDRARRAIARDVLADADVLHLHGMWLPSNAIMARLARGAGVPYVVSPHGMLNDWPMRQRGLKKQLFLRTIGRGLVRGAAAFACTARGEAEQATPRLRRRGFTGPVEIVPLAIETSGFRDPPDAAAGRHLLIGQAGPIVLYLGRIHPSKGLPVLLEATRRLSRPATVAIAGNASSPHGQALQRLARGRGDVRFLGPVSGEAKWSLYAAADVFASPTYQENFGLTLVEAMGCGTPVVTTRFTDIWPEIEAHGGRIALPEPAAFAAALADALADPDDLRERGERGRRWVLNHLAADRVAPQYRALYRRAVG